MFKQYGAILFGTALGYLALIPSTALSNSIATRACQQKLDTHALVTVRGFAGNTRYCIDSRYL